MEINPSTDQDWFKFSADEYDALTIICDVTSDLDAKIVLYYNGTRVAYANSNYSGKKETLTYAVPAGSSGTYYVGIGYYSNISKVGSTQGNTGSYILTIQKEGNIVVTNPNSSTQWKAGDYNVPIEWNTGGLGGNVKIELYKSSSKVTDITTSTSNDGSYSTWDVPTTMEAGTNYRVKITSLSNSNKYDYSDYFTINGSGQIVVTNPNSSIQWTAGDNNVPIEWSTGGLGGNVKIELYKGSSKVTDITTSTSNSGSYSTWDVPTTMEAGTDYRVKITSLSNSSKYAYSDYFTINAYPTTDPYEPNNDLASAYQITFTNNQWTSNSGTEINPSTDQDWFKFNANAGEKLTITCDVTSNLDAKIVLYYNGSSVANQDQGYSGADETLSYTVPSGASGTYYVGIGYYNTISKAGSVQSNTGSYTLTIQKEGNIIVTNPNSSTQWTAGDYNVPIEWNTGGLGGNVKIELYKSSSKVTDITTSTSNDGSYSTWDVPTTMEAGTDYRVKITSLSNSNKYAYSDYFTINAYPTTDPYEPNNDLASAYQITFTNNQWTGSSGMEINPSTDQDWFKFSANGGDELTITCDVTSSLDAKVVLYYNGTLVASKDGSGNGGDETLTYTVPSGASGTYYAGIGYYSNIFKISSVHSNTGSYQLTIHKVPTSSDPYEPNDDRSSAYQISFTNNQWTGSSGTEINPSTDQDWFKFSANEGDELTITCDVTSNLDAEIVLYYNGSRVSYKDDSYSGGGRDADVYGTCWKFRYVLCRNRLL